MPAMWSPELEEAMKEYEDCFLEEYPIFRYSGLEPDENIAEIRRRINENDPAPPMTEEETEDYY